MKLNFRKIAQGWGLKFSNLDLFKEALTHRSYLNEHKDWPLSHNERLEFLGDAVLDLIAADYLFKNYPHLQEGKLTNLRASLVNTDSLLEVAKKLRLHNYLLVSHGEEKDLESSRPHPLANAVEAIIGALYSDGGLKEAQPFIQKYILKKTDSIIKNHSYKDPKSLLQEKSQMFLGITPRYKVEKEWGPDHAKQFRVAVYLGEKRLAQGEGFSKQNAEVAAARKALEKKITNVS